MIHARHIALLLALACLAGPSRAQDPSPASAPPAIGTSAPARYTAELGLYELVLPAGTHTLVLPLAMPDSRRVFDVFGPELFDIECVESWDAAAKAWRAYFPGRPAPLAGSPALASAHVRVTLRQPLRLTLHGSVADAPAVLAPPDARGPAGVVWPRDVPFALLEDRLARSGFVADRDPLYYWDVDGGRWAPVAGATGDTTVRATTAFNAGSPPAPRPGASPSAPAPGATPRPPSAPPSPRAVAELAVRRTATTARPLTEHGTTPAPGASPASEPAGEALSTSTPATAAFAETVDSSGSEIEDLASYTALARAPVEAPKATGYKLRSFYKKNDEPTEALAVIEVPESLRRLAHLPGTVKVRVHYQDEQVGKLQAFEVLGVATLALDDSPSALAVTSGSTKPLMLFIGPDGALYGKGKAPATGYPGASGGFWNEAATAAQLAGVPVTLYYNPALAEAGKTGPVLQVQVAVSASAFAFRRWGITGTSPLPAPSADATAVAVAVGEGLSVTRGWWVEVDATKVPTLKVQLATSWRTNTLPAKLRTATDGQSVTAIDATGVMSCTMQPADPTVTGNVPFPAIGDGSTPLVATLWTSGRMDVHKDAKESLQGTADVSSYVFSDERSIAFGITPVVQVQGKQLPTLVPSLALTLSILITGESGANEALLFITGAAQARVQLGEIAKDLYAKKATLFSSASLTSVRDAAYNLFHPTQGAPWTTRLETLGVQTASLKGGLAGAFGLGGGVPVAVYITAEKGVARQSVPTSPLVTYTKIQGGLSVSRSTGDPGDSFAMQIGWQRRPSSDGKAMQESTTVELDGEYQLPSADPAGSHTDLTGQITAAVNTATPLAGGKPTRTRSFTFDLQEQQTKPAVKAGDSGLSTVIAGENFTAFTLDDFLLSFGSVDDGSGTIKRTGAWLVEMTARWKNADAQPDQTGSAESGEGGEGKKDDEPNDSAIDLTWTLQWDSEKTTAPSAAPTTGPTFLSNLRSFFSTDLFSLPNPHDCDLFVEAEFENVPSSTPHFKLGSASFALSSVEKHSRTTTPEVERSYAASLDMKIKPHDEGEPFDLSMNLEKSAEGIAGGVYVEDVEVAKDSTLKEAFVSYATPPEGNKQFYRGLTFGGVFQYDDTDRKWLHPAVLGCEISIAEKQASVFGSLGSTCAAGAEWCFKSLSVSGTGTIDKEKGLALALSVAGIAKLDFVDDARLEVDAQLATKAKPHLQSLSADLSAPVVDIYGGWRLTNIDLAGQRDNVTNSFSALGKATVVPPDNLASLGGFIDLKPISASFSRNAGQLLVQGSFGGTTITIPGVGWKVILQNIAFKRASPWRLDSMKAVFSAGTTTHAVDVTPSTTGTSYRFAADPNEAVIVPLGDYSLQVKQFALLIASVGGKIRITLSGHATILGPGGQDLGEGDLSLEVGTDGSVTGMVSNLETGSGQGAGIGGGGIGRAGVNSFSITSTVTNGKRTTTLGGDVSFTFGDDWPGLAGKSISGHLQGSTAGDFSMNVTSALVIDLPLVPADVAITTFSITRTSGDFTVSGTANVTITSPISFALGAHRGKTGDPSFHCLISVGQQTLGGQKKWIVAIGADTSGLATPPVDLGPMGSWSLAINKLEVSSLPGIDLNLRIAKTTGFYIDITGFYKPPATLRLSVNPSSPIEVGSSSDVYDFSLKNLFVGETFPDVLGIGTTICLRVGTTPLFKILLNADDTFYALPSSIPPFGFPFFGDAEKETGLTLEIAILGFGGNITVALPRPQMPNGFDVAGLITAMMKGFQGDPGLEDTDADWQSAWDPLKQFLEKQEASILTIFRGPGMGNINLALPRQLRSVFPSLQVGRLVATAPCESGSGGAGDEVLLFPVWSGMHYLTDLIPALFPEAASDVASVFVHLMHYIVFIKQMMTEPAKIFHLIPEAHRNGSIDYSFAGSAAIHGRYAITDDTPLINTGQAPALPGFVGFVSFAQAVNDPLASRLPLMADVARQKFALLKSQGFSFVATGTQFSGTATDEWVNPHDQAVQSFQIIPTFVPAGQVFSQNEVLQRHIARMTEKNGGLTFSDADAPLPTQDRRASLRLMGSTGRLQVTNDDGKVLYTGSAQLMGLTTVAVSGMPGRLELDAALQVSGTQFTSTVKAQIVFPFTQDQLDQKAQHDSCVAENRKYQSDLNAYYAWWGEYNRRVQQARNTWANTASNLDWGSIEGAMNKDHSFSCLFEHYSPGSNWRSLSSTLGQIGPFIAGLENQGDGSCSCVRYAREEILSEVSAFYPFENAVKTAAAAGIALIQPMSTPAPQMPYPPQCVDPGAPVQKAAIPLKWTHSAPLFVTGADAIRKSAGPGVTGWIAAYDLDDKRPGAVTLTFTDWGTVKFEGPGCRFTMVYPGALLTDFHKAVHTVKYFQDAIFSYDSSPYVLGLNVWTMLFPPTTGVQSADRSFTATSVVAEGRTVRVALAGSDVAMSMTLQDIGYHLSPPSDGGGQSSDEGVQSLDVATDIQSFTVKDGDTLVAKPFTVTIAGSSGASDQKPVQDLVIFEGGDKMAAVMDSWRKQNQSLKPTDLGAFEKLGLTVQGQPVVVRDLVVGVEAGQVESVVRPQRVDFVRRSDGITLTTVNADQKKLLAALESAGPYGDPLLYPTRSGQWIAYVFDQPTSQWSSTVTSSTTATLKAMDIRRITRTFSVQQPPWMNGTFTQTTPGMFKGAFQAAGMSVNLDTPQGYSLSDPHGTQATVPMSTVHAQTLVDDRDVPLKTQPDLPANATFTLAPDGKTKSGFLTFNGGLRTIAFPKKDMPATQFTYPTGNTLSGGLGASLTLYLGIPSVLEFTAQLEGVILNDGYYNFQGEVDLTLAGLNVADGFFDLNRDTGLTVLGKLDFLIAESYFDGNVNLSTGVHAVGHLAAGIPAPTDLGKLRDFKIDKYKFTGIDATMALDSAASPYLKLDGDALIYGGRVLSAEFIITNKEVAFSLQESAGPVSVDLGFTLSWGDGDFKVKVDADCGLDLWLGTVHAHFGGVLDIGSHPSLCISIGPGYAQIGFNPFSLGGGLGDCN